MFKLSDVNAKTKEADEKHSSSNKAHKHGLQYIPDTAIVVLMGVILFWGATSQFPNQFNDATRYQCYAVAFWQGTPGLAALPPKQCDFLNASTSSTLAQKLKEQGFPALLVSLAASQNTSQPLHLLPPEYPLLTILPFSLALVVPPQWYQVAFAICMALVAGVMYFVLKRYRARSAAMAFAAYLVIGSWALAETRFDLITAGLTLGAVLLAARARWKWAFALLALGTLLKFYPVILIPPLLIAQQLQSKSKWNSWQRWQGLGVFAAICAGVTAFSLILNVVDTLSPFRYFFSRPIQLESSPATLVWLGSFLGYPIQYVFTFQSNNVLSPLASKISILSTVCLVAALLYTFWLQWRGKIDIFMSSLLTLLIVIAAGKVFSPQYLIWVAPLVAYVGKSNWKWLISWGSVALLTTIIFPFIYNSLAEILQFYFFVVARDALMVAIVLVLLYAATRNKPSITVRSQDNSLTRGWKNFFIFIDFHSHFPVKCRHEIKPVCKESWD